MELHYFRTAYSISGSQYSLILVSHEIRLRQRPFGMPTEDDFQLVNNTTLIEALNKVDFYMITLVELVW